MQMKRCNVCLELLPATDNFFYVSPVTLDGLFGECKKCFKEKKNARYHGCAGSYLERHQHRRMAEERIAAALQEEPEKVYVEPLSYRGLVDSFLRVGHARN